MNHQPFELWLLDELPLTPEQKRELDAHVRTCPHCTALTETGLALRSRRMVSPAPGFSSRFQARLAAQRVVERRKRFWGVLIFLAGGLGLLAWLAVPFVERVAVSPAETIAIILGYFLFVLTSLRALMEVSLVLLRVAPGFVPSLAWMILFSAVAGTGLFWTVSIWRFTRVPQGV